MNLFNAFGWFLAIGIPILIHLFYFRKTQTIYFSDIRFLKKLDISTNKSKKIKNVLILLSRVLAFLFLITAFILTDMSWFNKINKKSNKVISIYIDNSLSMLSQGKTGTLLDEAKTAAISMAKSSDNSDRLQLLTNDLTGIQQRLINKSQLLDLISNIKPSLNPVNIEKVYKIQSQIFQNNTSQAFRYWFTDFQKSHFKSPKINPTDNSKSILFALNALPQSNLYFDSVWFENPVIIAGESASLIYKVKNIGDVSSEGVRVSLQLNGSQKGVSTLELKSNEVRIDTFKFTVNDTKWQKGILTLDDNPINFDDTYNFTFKATSAIPVMVLFEKEVSPYLKAFFENEKILKPSYFEAKSFSIQSLSNYKVVIIDGLTEISSGLSELIQKSNQIGNQLILFPSSQINLNSWSTFLQQLGIGTLGNELAINALADNWNTDNSFLMPLFLNKPKEIESPFIKRCFPITVNPQKSRNDVLTAENKSLLSIFKNGTGSIFWFGVPLNDTYSNFHKGGMFAPILYKACFNASNKELLAYRLGEANVLSFPISSGKEVVYKFFNENGQYIPSSRKTLDERLIYIPTDLSTNGFYTLKQENFQDSTIAEIAMNMNKSESEMDFMDESSIKEFAERNSFEFSNVDHPKALGAKIAQSENTAFWKIMLALSLLFFAFETLLIRIKA